jgi:hypothetical protein
MSVTKFEAQMELIPRAKLSGTILMRHKLQKQSALKLAGLTNETQVSET